MCDFRRPNQLKERAPSTKPKHVALVREPHCGLRARLVLPQGDAFMRYPERGCGSTDMRDALRWNNTTNKGQQAVLDPL
jgi:hypothetical protein